MAHRATTDRQGGRRRSSTATPNNEPARRTARSRIDWYGFDKGDLFSDVTFETQAPTSPQNTVLLTRTPCSSGRTTTLAGGSEAGLDASEHVHARLRGLRRPRHPGLPRASSRSTLTGRPGRGREAHGAPGDGDADDHHGHDHHGATTTTRARPPRVTTTHGHDHAQATTTTGTTTDGHRPRTGTTTDGSRPRPRARPPRARPPRARPPRVRPPRARPPRVRPPRARPTTATIDADRRPDNGGTTTTDPTVAPTTVSPGGTAFTGVENVVPLGAIALMLMTSGSGLLWAGSRRKRDQDQDEE